MTPILPVSLILTTLNEEKTIRPFFESVLQGTHLPEEIVVCDGGSQDTTLELLRDMDIPGVRVVVLSEPGATIARGRNTAIAYSTYDVLAISDAGCTLNADWLHQITAPLLDNPETGAVSGGYMIWGESQFERCAAAAEMNVYKRPAATFIPSSRSFAVRKQSFLDAGGYPEHLSFAGEDTALCLRMKEQGTSFVLKREAMVYWKPRPSLRAYIRQHWLYGVGDGEASINGSRYKTIAVKLCIAAGLLVIATLFPLSIIAILLLLQAYFLYLFPKYEWHRVSLGIALCAYMLIFVKDISTFAGFIKGTLNKPSGNGERP